MQVKRFESAAILRNAAEPFLMRHEAHHNLLLGLIGRLEHAPDFYGATPYFAAVESEGQTLAAAVMTPPHPVVVSLSESDEALAALASDLHAFRPDATGVNSPNAAAFAEAWQRVSGESCEVALRERCYRLERLEAPTGIPGLARPATPLDAAWLARWVIEFQREAVPWEEGAADVTEAQLRRLLALPAQAGGMFVWEVAGEPVCIAGYGNATPNSMRIGPVYTPPEHRHRGYGSACTAAACRFILDSGKQFVTLFADLANPTSNHIYREIGFEPVCDALMIRFAGR